MFHRQDLSEKIFSRRAFFIGAVQLLGLTILGGRLAWLQIAQGSRYKMLSDKNRINIKMLAPLRGEIVDRFGVPLAVNIQNYRALIIPEQVEDLEGALNKLGALIELEDYHIKRAMKDASRSAKFIPILVKEDLSWEEVAKVEVNLTDLPGVFIDLGHVRSYPLRESTAHVVGYVRSVSQDDLKDDDPLLRLPGFKIGKTGIEKVFDKELRGKAGASEVEVNVIGREVRELKRHEAKAGERVTLTIDGELQRFVQEALAIHRSASAVVMDAKTGAVYAMASHPSFDPSSFARGLTQEEWQLIRDDPALPQTNKAVSGQYPPGSTFKMITALAALEAGVINRHTRVFCPGHYDYGKDKFHCWKRGGHGSVDLVEALAQSCDTYFYKIATEVGIQKIAEMSHRFGLGDMLDFEIQEEKSGLIPDANWKRGRFGTSWQPGETIVASIGQGYILTTPLQLATMTSRLVNGGYGVFPRISQRGLEAAPIGEKININEDHLRLVLKGMNAVVNGKRGTAQASRIADERYKMAGKTGTSQVQRITKEQRLRGVKNEELPWEQRHHALFVGYAPVDNPRYVCSVVVEHGVGGSTAAAPLAKEILLEAQLRDPARIFQTVTPGMKPDVDDAAPKSGEL